MEESTASRESAWEVDQLKPDGSEVDSQVDVYKVSERRLIWSTSREGERHADLAGSAARRCLSLDRARDDQPSNGKRWETVVKDSQSALTTGKSVTSTGQR
jgi:hypothetical protein